MKIAMPKPRRMLTAVGVVVTVAAAAVVWQNLPKKLMCWAHSTFTPTRVRPRRDGACRQK